MISKKIINMFKKFKTNEEYRIFFSSKPFRITKQRIEKYYLDLIKEYTFCETIFEKFYCFINEIETPKLCNNCNLNKTKFISYSFGYRDYCSVKCSSNSEKKKNDIISSNIEKYGVPNISTITREKAKETQFNLYGGYYATTEEYKKDIIIHNNDKYGVDWAFQSNEIKEKIYNTNNKKYGFTIASKNKNVIEKGINTKIKKGIIKIKTEEDLIKYKIYKKEVIRLSNKNYKEYYYIINPNNYKRGFKEYHLDHIYPIYEGFKNNFTPLEISDYRNLRIINWRENKIKGKYTNMTKEDFLLILKK